MICNATAVQVWTLPSVPTLYQTLLFVVYFDDSSLEIRNHRTKN